MTTLYTLTCYSILPYVQKRYLRKDNTEDDALYRLTWALKDGRLVNDSKGQPTEPCTIVMKRADRRCPALAADRVLVPVPRKVETPDQPDPASWPGLRIARAMRAAGFGKDVVVALRRRTAVSGSTGKTSQADRVTVQQHIDSLRANVRLLRGHRSVTLVDDTITTGTQLMGAMRALQLAGFDADFLGLTALHALQDPSERPRNVCSVVHWTQGEGWAQR